MPRTLYRLLRAVAVAMLLAGVGATPAAAADAAGAPEMSARALLEGHARAGAWIAVAVDLTNEGPPITGELRMTGGTSGRTRYSLAVDLPTQSDKRYVIHAQAPTFGGKVKVSLVTDAGTLAEREIDVTIHDASQLVIGVVAERPQQLTGLLRLEQGPTAPAIVALDPSDLPDRVEAWSAIDRLLWQDVDTDALSTEQLSALAGWVGGGGRLVVVAGTNGPDVLSALPDSVLPYRPLTTIDVPAAALDGLLGVIPGDAPDIAGWAGELARGRALIRVGDQVAGAETSVGTGSVTILGVDPTTGWLSTASGADALWRRLLPPRTGGVGGAAEDTSLLGAIQQLPALALPPIGALLALLAGYIVLVGPVNYLILRRLDRREWAWISIPALVVGFSVGAYSMGAAIRGSDVIVHQVAIVRGTDPGHGSGLVYAGVFSPSRGTYEVSVPGGALLSAPVNGDFFGGTTGSSNLDIVQGDPARVRGLAIGFGSLRALRAEGPVATPTVRADLRLEGERVVGSVTNTSDMTLDQPALVLGSSVQTWPSLAPGETVTVGFTLIVEPFRSSLSDKVVGQGAFSTGPSTDDMQRLAVRRALVDQLTWDPQFGYSGLLPADGPVLLGWTDQAALRIELGGQAPRLAATTLYHLPLAMSARGDVVLRGDMIRSTVVASDAQILSRDKGTMAIGQGSLTMAYRPIGLDGALHATRLVLALGQAEFSVGDGVAADIEPVGPAQPIEPCLQSPCDRQSPDLMPEVEILDLETSSWMALPHLEVSRSYALREPARYVEPETGTAWIRFQNVGIDQIWFNFAVRLEGTVG